MCNDCEGNESSFNTGLLINISQVTFNPIYSPCVGIFWLSVNFAEITDITGFRKIIKSDLWDEFYIQPRGGHYLHNFSRDQPRGQLEVDSGYIKVYLGEDFPKELENSIKDQIVRWFRLEEYKDLIRFVYHYHWNTKDGASREQIRIRGNV